MAGRETEKRPVIERIFAEIPKDAAGKLTRTEITQADIQRAIQWCKAAGLPVTLSEDNPANFFKDIIRHDDADRYWPDDIFKAGYTARQITGEKRVFEFTEVPPGQTEPFPNPYYPTANTPVHKVQSVSMTIASKVLGREDETWMTQVLVRLNVVPTHFALVSPRRQNILHIDHLQMGVKRRGAEIDALFMGVEKSGNDQLYSLITFEAKQRGERLIHEQLARQVEEGIKLTAPKRTKVVAKPVGPRFELVIPCGIKNMGESKVYLIEFEAIKREEWTASTPLTKAAEAMYQIEPPVPGI